MKAQSIMIGVLVTFLQIILAIMLIAPDASANYCASPKIGLTMLFFAIIQAVILAYEVD